MNLAVGAILLFILFILPSLIFRRFYYTGEFSKEYFKSTPFQVFLAAVAPGVIFQALHYLIAVHLFGYEPDLDAIATLALGGNFDAAKAAVDSVRQRIGEILFYNVSLWIWAGGLAVLMKFAVRKSKLDKKTKLFRFQNHWYYVLRGEILDFPNIKGKVSSIDFTYIDAVVSIGGKTFLYSGLLEGYQLTKEGSGLEQIYLSEVRRRNIEHDSDSEKKYYHIPGDFFILPYHQIINMNISYYSLESLTGPEWDIDPQEDDANGQSS